MAEELKVATSGAAADAATYMTLAGSAEREVAASEAAADAASLRQRHLTPPSAGHSGWPRKSRRPSAG